MSEMSRNARRAMRAKAHRLANEKNGKIDASDYGGEETLHADIKTGMRPISRQARKSGGKVEGADAAKRADKAPRTGNKRAVADYVNRDLKEANEDRAGIKHDGGLKRGGRAEGGNAGDSVPKERFAFSPSSGSHMTRAAGLKTGGSVSDGAMQGTRPTGGRLARKSGGRAGKGKVDVNIVIAGGQGTPQMPPPGAGPGGPPRAMPVAVPGAGAPPQGLGAAMAGGAPPMPPQMPAPMPRKRGGRVSTFADLKAGAGSGEGRLEKIDLQRSSAR